MKRRDPETRQQQIIEAALIEFSADGRAGARIDRIAQRAGCSVGLIYARFGSKDQLFDALYDEIVSRALEDIPIDALDLPGYAGGLFDAQAAYPEVIRVSLWHLLQDKGENQIDSVVRASKEKIAAIKQAQDNGQVASRLAPEQLFLLVIAIASMWSTLSNELAESIPNHNRRRQTVVDAVRRLVEP